MSFRSKVAIFFLALFVTFAGLEVLVKASSTDEVLRLARHAGDHRLFSIVAHNAAPHVLGSM